MGGNRELSERFIASLEARDWAAWAGLLHPAACSCLPWRVMGWVRRNRQPFPGHEPVLSWRLLEDGLVLC